MTPEQLARMHENGMVLGSHTVNHHIMSKLTVEEHDKEIVSSFQMIEAITRAEGLKTFWYPMGAFHTFTAETEPLLERHSCGTESHR